MNQPIPEADRAETANHTSGVGVRARALTRRFGNHLALERIDLQIAPRARFSLLGANGAGKTTFIRMLTGFLLPSSGALTVDGISPARHPHAVNQRIGFAMETSRLYPELRVRSLLRFLGGARGLRGNDLENAVDRVIERFQLAPVATRADWKPLQGLRAARLARSGLPRRAPSDRLGRTQQRARPRSAEPGTRNPARYRARANPDPLHPRSR